MENHHFSWENPLFLWPFSIAMLNYQRVLADDHYSGNSFLYFLCLVPLKKGKDVKDVSRTSNLKRDPPPKGAMGFFIMPCIAGN